MRKLKIDKLGSEMKIKKKRGTKCKLECLSSLQSLRDTDKREIRR